MKKTVEKDKDRGITEDDSIAAGDSINVSITDISIVGKTKQVESSDTSTSTTTKKASLKKTKVTLSSKKPKGKKKLYIRVKAVGTKKWSKPVKIKVKK